MRQFEQRRRAVDELIYEEIARRREAPDLDEREDVFSMLLLARDEDGEAMSDQELRDELVTLLVAGHETTATGLAWAFELLLRNPRVLDAAARGLAAGDDALPRRGRQGDAAAAAGGPGVGRVVRGEPFELGGYVIPPGVEINPSIARDPPPRRPLPGAARVPARALLGPDAPDTYTWLPFGGGTRRCLGASFATFEMQVVIRRVLERTQLEAVGRRPEKRLRKGVTFVAEARRAGRAEDGAAAAPRAAEPSAELVRR